MPTPLTQSIVNAATTKTRALIADGGFRGKWAKKRQTHARGCLQILKQVSRLQPFLNHGMPHAHQWV